MVSEFAIPMKIVVREGIAIDSAPVAKLIVKKMRNVLGTTLPEKLAKKALALQTAVMMLNAMHLVKKWSVPPSVNACLGDGKSGCRRENFPPPIVIETANAKFWAGDFSAIAPNQLTQKQDSSCVRMGPPSASKMKPN